MSKAQKTNKRVEELDEEVTKRLPFWVKELLKLLDEVEREKKKQAGELVRQN